MDDRSSYQAYLLRCWQEEGTGWRFRLQDVQTGKQMGFTNVKKMLVYLRGVFEEDDDDRARKEETTIQGRAGTRFASRLDE